MKKTIKIINLTPESATKREMKVRRKNKKAFSYMENLYIVTAGILVGFFIIVLLTHAEGKEITSKDVFSSIETYNGQRQAVTAYASQIREMKKRGMSDTRILDLLALKSMECNRYDGLCYGHGNADLGPFQINKIHKDARTTSAMLMDSGQLEGLFKYQLTFADNLVSSYMDRFCSREIFESIGRTYTNERRFKCVAVSYNGSARYKKTYAILGWKKREEIKKALYINN